MPYPHAYLQYRRYEDRETRASNEGAILNLVGAIT